MPALLLISGSLREGSTNTAAIATVAQLAPAGLSTFIYPDMGTLPHFNPDDDREGEPVTPAVRELRERVAASDAILVCVPEYAGDLPGSFKRIPLTRDAIGPDGLISDPAARSRIAAALAVLLDELASHAGAS